MHPNPSNIDDSFCSHVDIFIIQSKSDLESSFVYLLVISSSSFLLYILQICSIELDIIILYSQIHKYNANLLKKQSLFSHHHPIPNPIHPRKDINSHHQLVLSCLWITTSIRIKMQVFVHFKFFIAYALLLSVSDSACICVRHLLYTTYVISTFIQQCNCHSTYIHDGMYHQMKPHYYHCYCP